MDIYREFQRRPPRESLDSLSAVVRDWKWRIGERHLIRDPVVQFTSEADSWQNAVYRAVASRDSAGKMHNHQSRVPSKVKARLYSAMVRNQYIDGLYAFDQIYDAISCLRVRGIGPVTTYDVAVRLGAWMGVEPESLYLHAGVHMGWAALGLPTRGRIRVRREEWPRAFRSMPADELEDFICTYRFFFRQHSFSIH